MATQLAAEPLPSPWAKTGMAKHMIANARKTKLNVRRMLTLLYELPSVGG
jgi:hypothetical protein